jgi:hypothetical protein
MEKKTRLSVEKFLKLVDLKKFPNITVMSPDCCSDGGDIVVNGKIDKDILKSAGRNKVIETEDPNNLEKGPYGTYMIRAE